MTETFNWRVRVDLLTALLSTVFGFQSMSAVAQTKSDSQAANDKEAEYQLNIPRTGMAAALQEFSNQTGLNVGWFPDNDEQKQGVIGPLKGLFTANNALVTLLKGTEFEIEWLNPRSLYIFTPEQDDGEVEAEPEESIGKLGRSSRRPVESGTVIVIASRIDVDVSSPSITSLNEQTIESYGVSTLAELFLRLPQVPYMRAPGSRVSGEQYVDLRGLGAGTTLVLINGRRVAASATSFDTSAFDLNTIPLTAVKRIEVFLDSHSVALGADAMGGIVNIVLKDDIPEPVVQLKFGAADGGAEEGRGSLGLGWSNERFRTAATLDFFHREYLSGAERDLTRDQDFRRFGAADGRWMDASPPTISSLTGENLPGLPSSFAAVPLGGDSMTIADFVATAGQRNLVSLNRFRSIVPKSTRASAIGSAELQLTETTKVFGEFFGVENETRLEIGPPTLSGVVIPTTNAFNPFGEPVLVNALVEGADATTYSTETSMLRTVLGAQASLEDWTVEISATRHHENAHLALENTLDPQRLMQALASADPSDALNLFRDGPPGSPALLRSLRANPDVQSYDSEHIDGGISIQGPALELPAGEMRLHFGGEWQREGVSTAILGSVHRVTSTAFGEIHVPLVASKMEIPAMETISLSLGVRADDGDLGTNASAQYGLDWHLTSRAMIGLSYRDFYRPPNLFDLCLPRFTGPLFQLPDPRRNHESSLFAVTSGGNPSLAPSSGQAWSARLEFAASEQLSMSASYWSTTIQNRTTPVTIPFALALESRFPERVQRADPTPQDLALGLPGALISVDASPGNEDRLEVDGLDLSVNGSWNTSLGRLSSTATATWNHSYETVFAPGFNPEQRVGIGREFGTIPRWRAMADMSFERDTWEVYSALRFVSAYDDAFLGVKNGRTVPASYQVDVQVSAQLDALTNSAPLRNIRVTVGAINLLDEEPPYSEVFSHFLGYDYTQADLRQRFWYMAVEKTF